MLKVGLLFCSGRTGTMSKGRDKSERTEAGMQALCIDTTEWGSPNTSRLMLANAVET